MWCSVMGLQLPLGAHLEASASAGATIPNGATDHLQAACRGQSASPRAPAPHAQCRRVWQHARNAVPPLVYYVTLWAQEDEAQFIGPHADLMRNGALIAASVAPFLQLASRAGVPVGQLRAMLVGPRLALLRLPHSCWGSALSSCVVPMDVTAPVHNAVTYWCHLCAAGRLTATMAEDPQAWQVARAKASRKASRKAMPK